MEARKIIFFGTPEFAVDSLEVLVNNGFHIAAVVTAPDQPAGRGQKMQSCPVKIFAESKGLVVLQPPKLKDPLFIDKLRSYGADLFIVVAFRMLPAVVWQMPPMGTFNLHASLLPQYRGAAPINHAIMNGETVTGLTTFFLKQEIDTGEIIFQEKISISADETAGELHDRMKSAGAGLVLRTVHAIFAGIVKTFRQEQAYSDSSELKAAPKIFKEDCKIDWTRTNTDIYNKIRGLSPYPAAFTNLVSPSGESIPVRIFKAAKQKSDVKLPPGTLITDNKNTFSIATFDGRIDILELQQAGKRRMNIRDFLKGFRVKSDWKVG